MICLSFSSLNNLHNHPHYWILKMMGAKMPEWDFFTKGKAGHRIIQDHLSGRQTFKALEFLKYTFPLVEEIDYDPRLNFRITISDKYEVQGFFDGLNEDEARMLEIKTGTIWSLSEFQKSYQRKIYSLLRPDVKEQLLISACADPNCWESKRPKVFTVCPTQKDRDEAMAWILSGITILESGNFYGDLVQSEDGKYHCTDPRCLYGPACLFR